MASTPIIIDCDPGVDDAMALLLAFGSPSLDIIAVTTVAGNVEAALTARNACIIRQIAGREEVPVHAGASAPLVRPPIAASHFHGESGLGWLDIFEPAKPPEARHAVTAIIEAVMSRPPGTVSLAVMGPMTNIALAMRLEPAIIGRLAQVVIMGGARTEGGNVTASAEYNIYADPHAAHVVFSSGARVVAIGLDATHQVRTTPERQAAISAVDTPQGRAARSLTEFGLHVHLANDGPGDGNPPLHDPCTVAYLLAPHLFTTVPVDLRVEIEAGVAFGHTAVEFRLTDPAAATVDWAIAVDAQGVFDLIVRSLSPQ